MRQKFEMNVSAGSLFPVLENIADEKFIILNSHINSYIEKWSLSPYG